MSGADLKTYIPQITELQQKISAGEVDEIDGCKLRDGTDAVLRSLKIYKPIIAAVNGPCVAGGMEMLGGVDIRIATEHASFGVMEPKRGLFAGGGTTVRLPRQIAFPAAMEFLLTAEAFPAAQALELGLLNEIVDEDDAGRAGAVVGGAHHRERPARRAGDEGERAARAGRRPARGATRSRASWRAGSSRARTPRRARRRSPRSATPCGRADEPVDPRTPCIIGVAQRTVRPDEGPSTGAARAVGGRDAAALPTTPAAAPDGVLDAVESLQIVYCMSWPYDRAGRPAGRRARASSPRHRLYSGIGGTTPQVLVQDAAAMILAGRARPRRRSPEPRRSTPSAGPRRRANDWRGATATPSRRRSRSRRRSIRPRSPTTSSRRG